MIRDATNRVIFLLTKHDPMINLRMSSFTYGHIHTKPVVPDSLTPLVIPGSEVAAAEGSYGKILLQQINAGEITILYNIYQAKEDIAIDFQCSSATLRAHIALKNDSQYYISGLGDLYLAEGQFTIIDAPDIAGTYFLEQGKEYRTMHVFFSSRLLDKLFPVFNYLQEWLESDSSRPRLLFKLHSWLSQQQKSIIDSILHCGYSGELLEFYRELKAYELICLALMPHSNNGNGHITPPVRLTRRNIALIHESKHILDNAIDQHITIAAVARQTGMNEFKLKAGFKQVFGISMFDYVIKKRMQAARNLLLETDKPLKEIASLTGYSTKQSFMNAFKKYFHDTPGSFRKN
jgi:AraC-like DNA-binding protein